ncbi:MAG: DegT/DnrJ/EryC1/StrS family aminotransferase [Clostridiales bacterium]|nr:DegT/DnrJ/EryC1/StrS family aminotransferase [Clostridiales bacterium]
MQFRDLKTQYKVLKREIDEAVSSVLTECNFISGSQVEKLETSLAEYVGTKYCITCGNGTDALTLMMMAWDIKEGDAVFVPDFTFFASGEIVSFSGATPVFYDVCEDTFNADIISLEKAVKEVIKEGKLRPRAIIAVDLFGLPADYSELERLSKEYNLLLLEDGAQGFGGAINGHRACSFGDAATTSFFPAKPLGCYGDGGAVFTNSDETSEFLRSIRVHGKGLNKYDNIRIGWNSRLDTLQAAVLQVKLNAFQKYELDKVNQAAEKYTKLLKGLVATPSIPEKFYSSWAQYTIKFPSKEARNFMKKFLQEENIPTMVYYPKPMHQQQAFKNLKYYIECPKTENLCDRVLSLPMHPYLCDEDIMKVVFKLEKGLRILNER